MRKLSTQAPLSTLDAQEHFASPKQQQAMETFMSIKAEVEALPVPREYQSRFDAFLADLRTSRFAPYLNTSAEVINVMNYLQSSDEVEQFLIKHHQEWAFLVLKHSVVEELLVKDFRDKMAAFAALGQKIDPM